MAAHLRTEKSEMDAIQRSLRTRRLGRVTITPAPIIGASTLPIAFRPSGIEADDITVREPFLATPPGSPFRRDPAREPVVTRAAWSRTACAGSPAATWVPGFAAPPASRRIPIPEL